MSFESQPGVMPSVLLVESILLFLMTNIINAVIPGPGKNIDYSIIPDGFPFMKHKCSNFIHCSTNIHAIIAPTIKINNHLIIPKASLN